MIRFLPLLFFAVSASAADIAWLTDDVVDKARLAAVTVETGNDFAVSGFFATEDGLVVTSATNLPRAKNVTVVTEAGKRLPGAKLLAINPNYNLAVLATGKKPPAWLPICQGDPGWGEPCVVLYSANDGGALIKAADGILTARSIQPNVAGTGFQDCWFVMMAGDKLGVAGAPAITREGHVSGVLFGSGGNGIEKIIFLTPGDVLREVLAQAGTKPLSPPAHEVGDPWHVEVLDDASMIEANRLTSIGDSAAAIPHFREALARHPDNPLIMDSLGAAYLYAGNETEAESHLRESVRIAPQLVKNQLALGLLVERKGDDQATLRCYQNLTTRFPQYGTAWGALSGVLLKTGDKAGALAAAKKWTSLDPGLFLSWDGYALALVANGDYEAADRARDKSRELEDYAFKVRYTTPKRK